MGKPSEALSLVVGLRCSDFRPVMVITLVAIIRSVSLCMLSGVLEACCSFVPP